MGREERPIKNNEVATNLSTPVEEAAECSIVDLPPFTDLNTANFRWGDTNGSEFCYKIDQVYEEAVHWRRNLFEVPRGEVGKRFVRELSRLIEAYSDASALVALKAAMTLPALLLQRPHSRSSTKSHIRCLEDRLERWQRGDIEPLRHECLSIQDSLNYPQHQNHEEGKRARAFEKLVSLGNVKAAIRLITEHGGSGSMSLCTIQPDGRSVKDHLLDKHPPGAPAPPSAISNEPPISEPHPIVFDQIDAPFIRSTALQMDGSAGPSGLDAAAWRRLCTSFHSASVDLCASIAHLTRRLCTSYVHPLGISSLTACRLIALDKCPGVRPIGVGETLRRLISKAILRVTRDVIQKAVGNLQLCAGQEAACEAGIHAMRGK